MEILPCPFCGHDDPYYDELFLPEAPAPYYFLVCPECECEGPMADTELGAAERWNRRHRNR